jgi:hypothetical protein
VAVQLLIAFADDANLSAKIRDLLIVLNHIRLEKSRSIVTMLIFAHECLETFQIFEWKSIKRAFNIGFENSGGCEVASFPL